MKDDETESAEPPDLVIDGYGVAIALRWDDDELGSAVRQILPPGWSELGEEKDVVATLSLTRSDDGRVAVHVDEQMLADTTDLELAVGVLDSRLRMSIAVNSPEGVFIHAGVVAVDGRAIVLPGKSFAGKTTLVAALLSRGATYYSDEYAVVGEDGLIRPFAKALSMRPESALTDPVGALATDTPAAHWGASVGDRPVPIGLLALATYRPGATWAPTVRTRAQGTVGIMANTPISRAEPALVLSRARLALASAVVLEGERGDSGVAADALLEVLQSGAD